MEENEQRQRKKNMATIRLNVFNSIGSNSMAISFSFIHFMWKWILYFSQWRKCFKERQKWFQVLLFRYFFHFVWKPLDFFFFVFRFNILFFFIWVPLHSVYLVEEFELNKWDMIEEVHWSAVGDGCWVVSYIFIWRVPFLVKKNIDSASKPFVWQIFS